jgi:hypothetical protein
MEPWRSGRLLGKLLELRPCGYLAAYKARFPTPQQMGKLTVTNITIEVLTDVDAIVFGHWMLAVDNKAQKGVFTVQLRKIEGDWLFVSDHSSTSE